MTLKAIVDTLEEVDEKYHDLYEEKDGKHVLKPVEGWKPVAEFNIVHTALGKERLEHKKTKTALTAFGELKPEEVRIQLERIPELEAAAEGKIDETKIEGMVVRRLKAAIAPVERERDQLKQSVTEKDNIISGYTQKERTRTLHDHVKEAALKTKIRPTAIDDATMLAERQLEVQEDGSVVTREGVPGLSPGLDVTAWLQDLQPKRSHWWEPSVGGGGRPGDGGGFGENPWNASTWNMTNQSRIVAADRTKAERMAKAAGSSIGAINPPAKK